MNDDNTTSTPETEPLVAGSGNRWERSAQPDDAPPADGPPSGPPPDTGAYPVVGAPVAKRRRARAAAAIAAAAVVAGAGGFGIGRATAGDDAVPVSNQVGDSDQGPERFGDRQFGDGDRPEFPGDGQPPGDFPGQGQGSGQDSGQGSATS